jgi:hypothetical protein
MGLISAHHTPNHIQVPQATVLHHHPRLTRGPHLRHQDPNRRPAPRTPGLGAAAPPKGQSAGGCQAAKGVQRPGRRYDQPHGETRRRMGSHNRQTQQRTATLVVAVRSASAAAGDSIAKPRSSGGKGKETRPYPHPFRRPLHPVITPGKAPRYPAYRWRRVYALHGHAHRVFHSAVHHIPHRGVSTGVLEEAPGLP